MCGTRRIPPLVSSLCAASLFLSGCAPPPRMTAIAKNSAAAAVPIATRRTRLGDVSRAITVTGSLVAAHEAALSVKQPGRLEEVAVREGDAVTAGQALARIDDGDLQRQVRTDEAAVASSLSRLRQAEAAYVQQKTTSEVSITAARAAYGQQVTSSAAGEQSADSALKAARANLSALQEGARSEERQQTQATLRVAEANCRKAGADLKRYRRLHDAGAISDGELDQYVTASDVADANLQAAQAAAEMQQNGTRRQDVEQAQERVRQAEEALRQARASRAQDTVRMADLKTAVAGRAQIRVRQADVESAGAALQQARNSLAIARQAVEDAVVTAPFSGRISARSAEPGQVVSSATVLFRLVSADGVYFEPSVPDDGVGRIHVGQRVDVSVDGMPGKTFAGAVSRIYPAGSSANRSVSLRITILSGRTLLRPLMFAVGRIYTETRRGVVLAPKAGISSATGDDASAGRLFTVQQGVAREHHVTVGISTGDGAWAEVTGIPVNAAVIVQGLNGLADGAKVTVNDRIAAP